jgi:hypothetical protein
MARPGLVFSTVFAFVSKAQPAHVDEKDKEDDVLSLQLTGDKRLYRPISDYATLLLLSVRAASCWECMVM